MSWDGSMWTSFGPVEGDTTGSVFGRDPLIEFLPDGTVWFGTLVLVDGPSLRQVALPTSTTNRQPAVGSPTFAVLVKLDLLAKPRRTRVNCLVLMFQDPLPNPLQKGEGTCSLSAIVALS